MTSIPSSPKKRSSPINYGVVIGTVALVIALALAGYRQMRPAWYRYTGNAEVRTLIPALTGRPELCLTCHYGIEEISDAHPTDVFGCVLCHGGDPLSLDQEAAHTGLYGDGNPADLAVVEKGCGGSDCHTGSPDDARDHVARVQRSIQSTYAGAINQLLSHYDARSQEDPYYGLYAVTDDQIEGQDTVGALLALDADAFGNPAVTAFVDQCLTCHLNTQPVMKSYSYRGTGCAACHVLYGFEGRYLGDDPTIPKDETGHPLQHRLTTAIPFTTCNACHYRGSYMLEPVNFSPRTDLPAPSSLPDNPDAARRAQYYASDVPFVLCEWELDCVDCHTTREAMGDGNIHLSKASAQSVQCKTCHGTLDELPEFIEITDPNHVALRRASLNPSYDVSVGSLVLLAPDGDTLGAVQLIGEQIIQIGKVTGKRYSVPLVMGTTCQQKPEQQEARYCRECHAYNQDIGR